jgi:hypothetical protein
MSTNIFAYTHSSSVFFHFPCLPPRGTPGVRDCCDCWSVAAWTPGAWDVSLPATAVNRTNSVR